LFRCCGALRIQASWYYAKKKTKRYQEQDPVKVDAYLDTIADIPASRIVYVDETGIDSYLYREYAYSPKGVAVYGRVSGHKYKRIGIVAAQVDKKIVSPLQYEGTMDSTLFELWFQERLLPALPVNSVIVMDNASFHRKKLLLPLAEKAGHSLIFLPPYSPELNPIENFWSWLKRHLKKISPFNESIDNAMRVAFNVS
jgi:transposase